MKNCSVYGLGYIGLPTAAILANNGYKVFGIDINKNIVETINKGNIHIKENGLKKLVSKSVSLGKLKAYNQPQESDIHIIAVPTPIEKEGENIPKPNIDYVLNAAKGITKKIKPNDLIIIESTSPIGTTEKIKNLVIKETGFKDEELNIAYCPERVIPGNTINELITNDRVIGGIDEKSIAMAQKLYSSFCKGKLIKTNAHTAELVKLSENAYRDINIAFANELSIICHENNINERDLIEIANHHPRVNILQPGCGVGGHCIAIDPWFIVSTNPNQSRLIQTARKTNIQKTHWCIENIKSYYYKLKKIMNRKPKIGCLGLTFKPNIDDIRESPANLIAAKLLDSNIEVLACEPNLKNHPKIKLSSLENVINDSDIIAILVAHKEFKDINTKNKILLDFSGISHKNESTH